MIVLGALGAIVGDSTLYWIARRSSSSLTPQLERARKNTRVGAVLWSTYTCVLAFRVGSSLDNYPLASVYVSGLITTVLMAVIFLVVRRRDRRSAATQAGS